MKCYMSTSVCIVTTGKRIVVNGNDKNIRCFLSNLQDHYTFFEIFFKQSLHFITCLTPLFSKASKPIIWEYCDQSTHYYYKYKNNSIYLLPAL